MNDLPAKHHNAGHSGPHNIKTPPNAQIANSERQNEKGPARDKRDIAGGVATICNNNDAMASGVLTCLRVGPRGHNNTSKVETTRVIETTPKFESLDGLRERRQAVSVLPRLPRRRGQIMQQHKGRDPEIGNQQKELLKYLMLL